MPETARQLIVVTNDCKAAWWIAEHQNTISFQANTYYREEK